MSQVITFYSYKGGVGRSMALANVSVMLSRWGHRVLVVDWDLEAPGLEHFYKDYIDVKTVETKPGVIDLLQPGGQSGWKEAVIEVRIGDQDKPIHLISSGKRDEEYFRKVRAFDVEVFYAEGGGEHIEQLRNDWLADYDYVLIDSRTGITEIGGICTIQLPDTVVMLFTATDHGFKGVLDIIHRASAAQQKLPYDRSKLVFLPIPSKFETNTEFKLSQEWLGIFERSLQIPYNDWLPVLVNRREFLELTKIPYIAYFSFGEKLPVIEQGVKDPAGLGYAYETLAALIAGNLLNVSDLINYRDAYIKTVNKNIFYFDGQQDESELNSRLKSLKEKLNTNEDFLIRRDNDVISECYTQTILPLFESLSIALDNFDSIFKVKEVFASITVEHYQYGKNKKDKIRVLNIYEIEKQLENIRYQYKDYIVESILFECNFHNIRKSNRNNIFLINLKIEFNNVEFDIKSNDGIVNVDKLYGELLSKSEMSYIVDAIINDLLEKIEATTNRRESLF